MIVALVLCLVAAAQKLVRALCRNTSQLQRIGKFLKYVAGKTGTALPGIIGTIVSFFYRVFAKVSEFATRDLYLALTMVVGIVVGFVGNKDKGLQKLLNIYLNLKFVRITPTPAVINTVLLCSCLSALMHVSCLCVG